MRVDGYVRVSQVKGRAGDRFISPTVQRERIVAWAQLQGAEILSMHEELDESGARRDRPQLMDALERVERGDTGGIVVARLDRFGRSLIDSLAAIARIEEAGGTFVSVDDGFDISTPTGRLVLRIMLSLAEFELDRIRATFATARAKAVERGLHLSPVAPAGYTRPEDDDGHVTGPLEPHPVYGPIVTDLFRRAARGESWAELGRLVTSKGMPTAYGSSYWPARAVKDLVRNRVYLGEARHGEFVNPHAHEPLTDELTFRQAQRAGRAFPPARSDHPALLSGLLRCAGCRHGLQSYVARSGRQYRCRRKYAAGDCPAPVYVSGAVIEPWVEGVFLDLAGDVQDEGGPAVAPELAVLEQAMRTAESNLVTFRDDPLIVGELGAADFAAGVQARRLAFEAAESEYLDARRKAEGVGPSIDVRAFWPDATVEEKRELLASAIDTIFLRRGRSRHDSIDGFAHVCLRGDAPTDLPRRGSRHSEPIRGFDFPD